MASRLSTLAVISSVALCVELIVGVHSCGHAEHLWATRHSSDRLNVSSEFGELVIEVEARQRANIPAGWIHFDSPLPRLWTHRVETGGFAVYRGDVRHYVLLKPTRVWGLVLPHWFVAIFCALPGIAWLIARRRVFARHLRLRRGLCGDCGYNLKANVSGVCPECGKAV